MELATLCVSLCVYLSFDAYVSLWYMKRQNVWYRVTSYNLFLTWYTLLWAAIYTVMGALILAWPARCTSCNKIKVFNFNGSFMFLHCRFLLWVEQLVRGVFWIKLSIYCGGIVGRCSRYACTIQNATIITTQFV